MIFTICIKKIFTIFLYKKLYSYLMHMYKQINRNYEFGSKSTFQVNPSVGINFNKTNTCLLTTFLEPLQLLMPYKHKPL